VGGFTRRDGTSVRGYVRGSGVKSKYTRRKVVGAAEEGDLGYVVNFKYSDKPGDGESVLVFTDPTATAEEAYTKAMDEAFEERVDSRRPVEIDLVDPSVGAMLKWVGERVKGTIAYGKPVLKKAAKLGAKYAVRASMATAKTAKRVAKAGVGAGKELVKLTAFSVERKMIERLIRDCYSKNKITRVASRHALKKRYPDIYDMCDFSREKGITWRKRKPKVTRLPRRYTRVGMWGTEM